MRLFRIAGKFTDGKTFSTRLEAVSAIAAATMVVAGIQKAGGNPDDVAEIHSRPMAAPKDAAVYIGEARTPKKRAVKAANNAAAPGKPAAPAQSKK